MPAKEITATSATSQSGSKTGRKRLGEQAEAAFLERAVHEGFAVAKSWGDSERYDFIIDAGGRFWRIQVKSSRYKQNCRYGYAFKSHWTGPHGSKPAYTKADIDIVAAYIVPLKLWYIIPIEALKSVAEFAIHDYPRGRDSGCRRRLNPYREAWSILRSVEAPQDLL